MGACKTFIRFILIIFNILFLLAGLFLVGFGAALKAAPLKVFEFFTTVLKDQEKLENGLGESTDAIAIFMIVLGVVVFVISLLGILSAITLKKYFLIPYVIILILILAAEIALIIVVVVVPGAVSSKLITDFSKQDSSFTKDLGKGQYEASPPTNAIGKFWYLIQNSFACCGLRSNSKFENAKKDAKVSGGVSDFKLKVPSSCCTQKDTPPIPMWNNTIIFKDFSKCKDGDDGYVNTQGCLDAFLFNANKIPIIIAAITVALEVVLIICSIIALCLHDKMSV